jgi:DNA-binding PadR family transcriptional regulator
MSRASDDLTVTAYAILGLLAIRSWTTYELAQQMRRSLRHFWPRAESRIYEEPKRLVAEGLARASSEFTGQRPRTVYSITPKGRRRLARWLEKPGAAPVLEFEGLLKVWLSENATKTAALANIAAMRTWAAERERENVGFAREILTGSGPFPERVAQIVVVGKFLTDFADMVGAWADWAVDVVDGWPDHPARAQADMPTVEAIASRTVPND